jgi:hypothetical protein
MLTFGEEHKDSSLGQLEHNREPMMRFGEVLKKIFTEA